MLPFHARGPHEDVAPQPGALLHGGRLPRVAYQLGQREQTGRHGFLQRRRQVQVSARPEPNLSRHVEALARRAPAFYSPPSIPSNPVEDDSEDDFGQDDNDDVDARNLQAHIILLHQLNTDAA